MAVQPSPTKLQHSGATYSILRFLNEGLTAIKICKRLELPRYTISRQIKRLSKLGYIQKGIRTSYQEIVVTPEGRKFLNEMQHVLKGLKGATLDATTYKINFRLHHVLLRIPIIAQQPETPSIMQKKGAYWKKRGVMHGWELKIAGQPVMYTTKSFLIYPQPMPARSVEECVLSCFQLMEEIRKTLKAWIPYIVLAEKTEICRQHLAMQGGITQMIPEGYRYQSDRLVIDYSQGPAELETISSQFSIEDMHVLMQHFEAIVRNEWVQKL